MKNLLRILVLLAGACPSLFAQQTYLQAFGQPQTDLNRTHTIVQLSDTTYILGGEWNGVGVLMKVNYKGTLLDYFFIDSYVSGTSKIMDLALDPGGNIVAVGECKNCLPGDTLVKVFAVHTEPSLLFINHKIYEGTTAANNSTFTPSVNRKGNQLLLAATTGGPGLNFEDVLLHGITANLDTLWRKSYNSCNNCGFDHVVDATPTGSGFAFLSLNAFTDSITLWHVNETGGLLWKKRHPWAAGATFAKLAHRSGTIYVAGTEQVAIGNKGGVIWRFSDSNGSLLGKISLDVPIVHDEAAGLEFSPDGTLLAVHRRTAANGIGGTFQASRIYRVNVANSQVIDFADIANPDALTGISATSVAPLSANGAEFAAGGFQDNPDRSFFFSKNGIEPQPPGVLFSASPDTACAPATIVLTNHFPGAQGYIWRLDGVQFSTEANPAPLQLTDGGAHVIKLDAQTSSTNKINTFTVNSLPEIWNECAVCDNKPDPFLRIKNAAGTVVYTSTFVESYPPVQLPVSFTMQASQTYKFEIWDDDNVGADDLFGTFTIPGSTTGGMFSLIHPEDPDNPLKITFTVTPTVATQSFTQNVVVFQPVATLTGGNILQATPGNPAPSTYSFQWQLNGQNIPGATGETYSPTASGNYTVTMFTPFCTAISDPVAFTAAFSASIAGTSPLCFGEANGSILVTPLGGTVPFSFAWNPATLSGSNPTNLPAGDYSVTVTDAQGQSATLQTTLSEPAELVLSAQANNPSCDGSTDGSISLEISGGTAPHVIEWEPAGSGTNPTDLPAGDYSATVTDANGCTELVEVTLVSPPALEVAAAVTNPTCGGGSDGSILLSVTGGTAPYFCTWNVPTIFDCNLESLPAGDYAGTITDANGCTGEVFALLTEPLPIFASTSSTPQIDAHGGPGSTLGTATVEVSGGTSPYTYEWSTSPVQTTQTATDLMSGVYSVTVTDGNGCTVVATVTVELILDASEVAGIPVNIYPNPTGGQVFIEANLPGAVRLQVFDIAGRLVLREEKSGLPCSVNLASVPEGLYLLRLQTQQGAATRKISIVR